MPARPRRWPRPKARRPGRGRGTCLSTRSPGHCPASVATSFQLGSRDDRSRANVHTSVTSVTFSGEPSMTAPERSRLTEMICDTKRTVTCAVRPAQLRAGDLGLVDRDELGLGGLALLLALADRGLEAVVDFARQQILQGLAVALRKRRDDHLVGGAGAGDKVLGIETRVRGRDRVEAGGDGRAGLGHARPALGYGCGLLGGPGDRLGGTARQGDDLVACAGAGRTASRAEYGS